MTNPETEHLTVRVPVTLLDGLDQMVLERRRGARGARMTRSDIVRELLMKAMETACGGGLMDRPNLNPGAKCPRSLW